jgi:hypothetical protein
MAYHDELAGGTALANPVWDTWRPAEAALEAWTGAL